jgi:hypothetical protein
MLQLHPFTATTAGLMRRLVRRDTLLLTLNGASIPAAWVGLWFVLSSLLSTD